MRNYAFISYSHKDKKIVKRLHRSIEGFKIPSYVRKRFKSAPKRIYPIFRDETDMSGVELTKMIKSALENSDFLIVICSSNSIESQWVNFEIVEFSQKHDTECIIPVSLNKLSTTDYNYVISQILGDERKISSAIRSQEKTAIFEIVTRILGCFSTELLERYNTRRKVQKCIKTFFLFIILLFVAIDFAWWFNNEFRSCRYYKNISYEYDWPHGVHELKKSELAETDSYYICKVKDNRIVESKYIYKNSPPKEYPGKFLRETDVMEYYYNNNLGNARISKVVCKDSEGATLYVKNYCAKIDIIDFTVASDNGDCYYMSSDITLIEPDKGSDKLCCRVGQIYDSSMRVSQIWFLDDFSDRKICDKNGNYGLEYVYNADGEVCSVLYMDIDGNVKGRYDV